ncbi:unnamed protein product [Acanthocheilonema viteae]|uniref:7TM GPCR serpentine receptor class x (Srx) domain-containing protein n=1 Tax=Acanthocheilonema viteae TaxID=6277 RepID=A0A498SDY0_ACAVI|nr:unnamed protein product [Acanthocheilonema viteae]
MPKILQNERLAYTVGQATIIFYYGAIYTHILIGLNRFIAIAKPLSYEPTQGMEQVSHRRRSLEIRYFIQSVCSETALILTFVCFWCIALYATTPFSMFVLNVGAWLTMHAIDGFIMTAFNHQILKMKTAKRTSLPIVTIALSAAVTTRRPNNNKPVNRVVERWLHFITKVK